jgi:capsid protein
MYMRDNGIYKGMLNRAVAYIVGSGFTLQARTADPDWNTKAEALWREYWKAPEIRGILSGLQVERMLCRELFVAGDTGILKIQNGSLQLIEAEQITDSKNLSGINLNTTGAIQNFSLCSYSKSGYVQKSAAKTYSPVDFLFIADPDRPSSTRSVPPCQASFPMIERISDVCDSEAIAWQILSRFAVAIEQAEAAEQAFATSKAEPDKSAAEGDFTTRMHQLEYALIFHGKPGEKVSGIERNIPGQNFTEALRMFLRLIGLPIGLPLELILLDWTQSNYSQSRAVIQQAYHQAFVFWQELLDAAAMSKIYLWKLGQWVANGELAKRDDMEKYEWIKPVPPWIDPEKETQAEGLKIDRGFTTHAAVLKSQNQDRDEVVAARDREVRDAIAHAQKIKADTGEHVDWQIFAGMRSPAQSEIGRPVGIPALSKDEQKKPEKETEE